jgi:hypothetical protein
VEDARQRHNSRFVSCAFGGTNLGRNQLGE